MSWGGTGGGGAPPGRGSERSKRCGGGTPSRQKGLCLALVLLLLGCGGPSRPYYRVELAERNLKPAEAIVVLGLRLDEKGEAATMLKNRMDFALKLHGQGLAPNLILTGGQARAGRTEAQVMSQMAQARGVKPEAIVLEEAARTTLENATFTARLLAERKWKSAIIVSDRGHLMYALPLFRDAFEAQGIALYWAPTDYTRLIPEEAWDWLPR